MAKYVVEPRPWKRIVMCGACGCMYYPETRKTDMFATVYEKCPKCGCATNTEGNCIPLWMYNLRKWYRGWFVNHHELKGQEIPEKVLDVYTQDFNVAFNAKLGRCPSCGETICKKACKLYCGNCGQAVTWENVDDD